jgi:ketosteroid isomerase-like protein
MKKYFVLLCMMLSLTSFAQDKEAQYKTALIAHNKKVVSFFFDALERKDYTQLKNIIDSNGKASYATQAGTKSEAVSGNETIRAQFQTYLDGFSKTDFQTEVIATEDPTLIMVKVKGDLEDTNGAKKETSYLATFKLKDGKIVEYIEYSSPVENHS